MKPDTQHRTAFYVEAFALIFIFLLLLVTLTRIFAAAEQRSRQAELLTNAVCLASNVAEAAQSSKSEAELAALLDTAENVVIQETYPVTICARYAADMTPDMTGSLLVSVVWRPQETDGDTVVNCHITVTHTDTLLYTLDTEVYLEERV